MGGMNSLNSFSRESWTTAGSSASCTLSAIVSSSGARSPYLSQSHHKNSLCPGAWVAHPPKVVLFSFESHDACPLAFPEGLTLPLVEINFLTNYFDPDRKS